MPAYRVYVVTTDGHIVGPAQVIECENEQDAIGQAAQTSTTGQRGKGLQMMPCFLNSACSSPDTQPKTFGSPSNF